MKKNSPEQNNPEFGEVSKIYRGRLGFKGSLAPDKIEGYILDLDLLLPKRPLEEVEHSIQNGKEEVHYKYSFDQVYKMAANYGIQEPAILKIDDADAVMRVNPEQVSIAGLVSSAGVTSHGFVILRSVAEYDRPSSMIAAGAVEDCNELKNGDRVELAIKGNEVFITKLKSLQIKQ